MSKLLVVVDMQTDFIDGSLGTDEAKNIVSKVSEKISSWDGDIVCTMDTHEANYLKTREGLRLPIEHCIHNSDGWQINDRICVAIKTTKKKVSIFQKETFGSVELATYIKKEQYKHIEFVGLCTDICVISNAILTKAFMPEADIVIDASCCAGVTPESHNNALSAMKMCQIDVVGE